MTRDSWSDYTGVGPATSEKLTARWETPTDFVEECSEDTAEKYSTLPTYSILQLPLLEEVDGIGGETANTIIGEMVVDLEGKEGAKYRE